MAREYLSFDNWTLGDTGRHGPMAYHYGRRKMLASYGHFRGLNVMRYPNGAVGPRMPVIPLPSRGLSVSGTIKFVEYAASADMLYLITSDGHVYRHATWVAGGGVWATVATGTTPLCTAIYGSDLYIGAAGGVYRVTSGGAQSGPFANSPANCTYLVEYREVLAGAGSATGTLQYSAPADGTTWPATNTLGIGSGNVNIVGLFAQKNSLVSALANGEWWTTTGFLTQGGTVGNDITRRADLGPTFASRGTSVMQSSIWYVNGRDACNFTGAQTGMELIPDAEGIPVAFFPTFRGMGNAGLTCTGIEPVLTSPDAFLVAASGVVNSTQTVFGFMRQGAQGWNRFTFPFTISPQTLTLPLIKGTFEGTVYFFTQQGSNVFAYWWLPRLETPYADIFGDPLVGSTDGDSGDVVAGSFSLPEWWVPDGGSAHVHGVIVDFEYDPNAVVETVANGNSPNSVVSFDVSVEALNLTRTDQSRASTVQHWTPPPEAAARSVVAGQAPPIRRREIFRMGDQGIGTGFRVNLTNMRGMVLYRLIVVVDLEDEKLF